MEEEEGGLRLSKRFSDNGGGEVDYKTKSGTAWSHSYLNQKPWHPLSYPNQRRKWIAEQTHSQRQSRSEEVAREYAQEQEFFRQTAMLSKKEKEKVDMMQAVSFMYVRPPGYNAESAKAAEIVDERKNAEQNDPTRVASSSMPQEAAPVKEEKKKPRPKDVFGRSLPTEEQFEVLKNAPRLETGVAGRAKPFAVEVRNVKCVRCGNYGHQSGDRECPLKDAIMPNEESRLKRDDPLTAILAHTTDPSEPLKWELKQKPGISPPRGGFKPDDPNQQIVAEEIFDEYGGFLSGGNIPELLTNFSSAKHGKKFKTKGKHKKHLSSGLGEENEDGGWDSRRKEKTSKRRKKTSKDLSGSSSSDDSRLERHHRSSRQTRRRSSRREDDSSDTERRPRRKENIHREREQHRSWSKHKRTHSPKSSESGDHHERRRHRRHRHHHRRDSDTNSSLE